MMFLRAAFAAALFAAAAGGAQAQAPVARTAPSAPLVEAVPPPSPDPQVWWENKEPIREERFDPLGGRRANPRADAARGPINNGVDAPQYRLWGLQPVQWLTLRRGEVIYEAWYRPTNSARQAVARVILRNDGRAFVQARAGIGCCAPEVTRRVDIDAELTPEQRQPFLRLREDPLWRQPRHVVVTESDDTVSSVCVEGDSYDLALVEERRFVHLRRACDPAALGSVAPALQAIIGAALGRDARFDDVFAKQKFANNAELYQSLVAGGGGLEPVAGAAANAPAAPIESADAAAEAATDAVEEILAADRAFAARSAARTAAEAFREFMAGDGLLFRENGEPIRGVDAIYARFGGSALERGKLLWEPAEAWASEDGTFGASWGRSRLVPADASQPTAAYRYLTVWRRDPDGRWKGLMDMGVSANDLLPARPPAVQAPASAPR